MYYIKYTIAFFVAASFVLPLTAQQPTAKSKNRVDTARTQYGSVVIQSLAWSTGTGTEVTYDARKDQLRSKKVAYFTNAIGLTSKEAERFWPVYNEFDEKFENLRNEQRRVLSQLSNFENMKNEKDVKILLDAYVNSRFQESVLFQEYHKKFSTILMPSKVVRLYQAEEEFRKMLFDAIRNGWL